MTRAQRLLVAVALALLVAGPGRRALEDLRGDRLAPQIHLTETVVDLLADFDSTAVEHASPDAPVRVDGILPAAEGRLAGGWRPALVTPPPSRVRFRVRPPAGARLAFGIGVEGPGQRQAGVAGFRFAVTVDGHEVFARTVNRAATRHDRRWFDVAVPLDTRGERDVEIALVTEVAGPGRPPAGRPGWSNLRLVTEHARARQQASPTTPNVLVVLVDTLRADVLGCYGARPSPSPTLDALAAGGRVFEQAVAQAPWTAPSVATLLTGVHPPSHGVRGRTGDHDESSNALPLALPTLAERAADAGITTVAVSGNPLVSRAAGFDRGFETFVEFDWERGTMASADAINAAFFRWLCRHGGHRFLAFLHYVDPHDPYTPPAPLRPPVPPGVRPEVAGGGIHDLATQINWHGAPLLSPVEVGHLRALYGAEVRAWDQALAAVRARLAASGLSDRTIVIVTADHGEQFQEHGKLKHLIHLYDEVLRVPLVVAGPGIAPGRTGVQVQGIDLFPTIARLMGFAAPAALPGRDLLGGAPDERPAVADTLYGCAADGRQTEMLALRTPRWKLIEAPALGQVELYDLAHDPGEHENVAATAPEAAALRAELARARAALPAPPRSARGGDPALREKLRALGYAE
ncbi:MAG: sulfatase [Candidatus Binatia bacterium]